MYILPLINVDVITLDTTNSIYYLNYNVKNTTFL